MWVNEINAPLTAAWYQMAATTVRLLPPFLLMF